MRQRGYVNTQKMIKDRRRQRAALHPRRKEVQHLRRAHTQWRTSHGLTQEELAIKMQLHGLQLGQMAISRIETGKRVVTDFELKLFSSVLGLSMDDLTAGDPSSVSSDPLRR